MDNIWPLQGQGALRLQVRMMTLQFIVGSEPGVWYYKVSQWKSIAVYNYNSYMDWWFCEEHGYFTPKMTVQPCEHIRTIQEAK